MEAPEIEAFVINWFLTSFTTVRPDCLQATGRSPLRVNPIRGFRRGVLEGLGGGGVHGAGDGPQAG
jgi:hypothetical protein